MTLSRNLIIAGLVTTASFGPAVARPIHLGSKLDDVKAVYTDAKRIRLSSGAKALELADVDYAGVRWATVDFVLGPEGRVASLVLHTKAISYERALELAAEQQSEPAGLSAAKYDVSDQTEIRVCKDAVGEITMTFEPETTAS